MRKPLLLFSLFATAVLWACASAPQQPEQDVALADISIRIDGFVQMSGIT